MERSTSRKFLISLAPVLLSLAMPFSQVRAQSPRLGPDSGTFKTTVSTSSSTAIMGMSMEMGSEMVTIHRVQITAAGRDTLRMKTTIDSISFVMTGPMAAMMGTGNLAESIGIKKGDSSVALVSSNGKLISKVAGSSSLQLPFSAGDGLPRNLTPGTTWSVDPPQIDAELAGDPATAALMKPMFDAMRGLSKMTFDGVVSRDGAQAWKFTTVTTGQNIPFPLPDVGSEEMKMSIKDLSGKGETYIDVNGRTLLFEYTQTAVTEMVIEGMTVQSTTKTLMRTERNR